MRPLLPDARAFLLDWAFEHDAACWLARGRDNGDVFCLQISEGNPLLKIREPEPGRLEILVGNDQELDWATVPPPRLGETWADAVATWLKILLVHEVMAL